MMYVANKIIRYNHHQNTHRNILTLIYKIMEVLNPTINSTLHTLLPSMSKWEKLRVMRYWSGATICQTQFLLGGYRSGKEGLCMVPLA